VLPFIPLFPVLEIMFSPIVTIAGTAVRVDTIALGVVFLACLVVAARIARRTPIDTTRSTEDPGPDADDVNHLRADDLLYVAVSALPGAVIGGRLGYALVHLDYYRASPSALLDISQGSLTLSLAVVGGFLTASIVAGLLGAPIGRWMHALVLPLLLALAGGKLAMALGGSGQGVPWNGDWATAYLGPGPWGSLAPAIPSHPSQVYEALAAAGVLLVMACLLAIGLFARRTGAALLLGVALWAVARAAVASTWRDPAIVDPFGIPLRMEQVICLVIAVVSLVLAAAITARDAARRRSGRNAPAGGTGDPAGGTGDASDDGEGPRWPDPEDRPRI
jgi:prolipoprotein diacylglyceryltransferase